MRIMILGAAGEIGRMLTANLLEQTNFDLTLYGRNVTSRLASISDSRVKLVDGTFEDTATIKADYHRESLGLGEPGADYAKPSFY